MEFGPYVPILRVRDSLVICAKGIASNENPLVEQKVDNLATEIMPDDTMIDAPSILAPVLLKKKTKWPPREAQEILPEETDESDEVQLIGEVPPRANRKTTPEYVRSATLAHMTSSEDSVLAINDFYQSSVGEMLLCIGLSQVNEVIIRDNIKTQARRLKKSPSPDKAAQELAKAKEQLRQVSAANAPYKLQEQYTCPNCSFHSAFAAVMDEHLRVPHFRKRQFLCNFCDFKEREGNQMLLHCFVQHKKLCHLEVPNRVHRCSLCPFENKSKPKLTGHVEQCRAKFVLSKNLELSRFDLPTLTAKPITQGDIMEYDRLIQDLRLASYNPYQLEVNARSQMPSLVVLNNRPIRQPVSRTTQAYNNDIAGILQLTDQLTRVPSIANASPPSQTVTAIVPANSTIDSHQVSSVLTARPSPIADQPNANDAFLPDGRGQASFTNARTALAQSSDLIMPRMEKDPNASEGPSKRIRLSEVVKPAVGAVAKPRRITTIVCEICDAYADDLCHLRKHMKLNHNVRLHQRMLACKPPLRCQKCTWRFFTDQGLERHLLGAHSLVTPNMQKLMEKDCDSGRCTICGRAFANKIVAHMREVHLQNLKPAHLSYKCTVCSAAYDQYRLFENHVYSVHRDSVKCVSSK